jgi:hypothetical protein
VTVNPLVVGSSPTRGAKFLTSTIAGKFVYQLGKRVTCSPLSFARFRAIWVPSQSRVAQTWPRGLLCSQSPDPRSLGVMADDVLAHNMCRYRGRVKCAVSLDSCCSEWVGELLTPARALLRSMVGDVRLFVGNGLRYSVVVDLGESCDISLVQITGEGRVCPCVDGAVEAS